jgi:hypothetical protein
MSEYLQPGEIIARQESWRQEIINSIFTDGLMTRREFIKKRGYVFGSLDTDSEHGTSVINGCFLFSEDHGVIHPGDANDRTIDLRWDWHVENYGKDVLNIVANPDRLLYHALYTSACSMFPTLNERMHMVRRSDQDRKHVVEERLHQTMVIVVPATKLEIRRFYPNAEVRNTIPSSYFSYVLIPESLTSPQRDIENLGFQVITVPNLSLSFTEKTGCFEANEEYVLPNYEETLLQLLSSSDQPLFIHGVRLPTEEDSADRLKKETQVLNEHVSAAPFPNHIKKLPEQSQLPIQESDYLVWQILQQKLKSSI